MTGYYNSQNSAQGAIPVYVVSAPSSTDPWPNGQGNAAGAIPVYYASAPGVGPWPNVQDNAIGAIPVRIVSAPSSTGPWTNDQESDAGAIPVYVVSNPGLGPWPNAQSNALSAIPVWNIAVPPTLEANFNNLTTYAPFRTKSYRSNDPGTNGFLPRSIPAIPLPPQSVPNMMMSGSSKLSGTFTGGMIPQHSPALGGG